MAVSNDLLSDDILESLLLIDSGMVRRMEGGFLLRLLTYCSMFLGFTNGL